MPRHDSMCCTWHHREVEHRYLKLSGLKQEAVTRVRQRKPDELSEPTKEEAVTGKRKTWKERGRVGNRKARSVQRIRIVQRPRSVQRIRIVPRTRVMQRGANRSKITTTTPTTRRDGIPTPITVISYQGRYTVEHRTRISGYSCDLRTSPTSSTKRYLLTWSSTIYVNHLTR